MGTTVEVQIADRDEEEANSAINKVFSEFDRLNSKYSTYSEESYISRLNRNDSLEIKVDPETYWLLKKCNENYKITEGGFDPAIGNLVKLLGFESEDPGLPSADKIKEKLQEVGWKHITLLDDNRLIRSRKVSLNFNAIVKGYAVDRGAEILKNEGIEKFLVNAGGEIKTSGKEWSIGIQHPRQRDSLIAELKLKNLAVATSGDYQQFFKAGGKRYTHILNPVTGYPADQCQSVTIIAEDVLTADAIATGLFVQGVDKGLSIVENMKNIEAMMVDSSGRIRVSSGFNKFTGGSDGI
jgi:thiamine biosynthesis lipoprotein